MRWHIKFHVALSKKNLISLIFRWKLSKKINRS